MLLFANLNNDEGEAPELPNPPYRMLRGIGVVLPFLTFLSLRGR